ncbi:MAG: hypothetical protein H6559_27490 [Lewinellaceae bacterium]|nr:hypothetical protein [Lewinellaceae bacterium]
MPAHATASQTPPPHYLPIPQTLQIIHPARQLPTSTSSVTSERRVENRRHSSPAHPGCGSGLPAGGAVKYTCERFAHRVGVEQQGAAI